MTQQVKEPVLSVQWLGLLPWHMFDPWPGHFYMLQVQQKQTNKTTT